ncbi:unnamed protein product [Ectocarpus sp. 13 AM-2016]
MHGLAPGRSGGMGCGDMIGRRRTKMLRPSLPPGASLGRHEERRIAMVRVQALLACRSRGEKSEPPSTDVGRFGRSEPFFYDRRWEIREICTLFIKKQIHNADIYCMHRLFFYNSLALSPPVK